MKVMSQNQDITERDGRAVVKHLQARANKSLAYLAPPARHSNKVDLKEAASLGL